MYNINVSLNLFWMGVGHYLSSAVVEDLKDAILGFQSFSTFKRLALSVTKISFAHEIVSENEVAFRPSHLSSFCHSSRVSKSRN